MFEFEKNIYVQVWKQRDFDLIGEMFLTVKEFKYLIKQSCCSLPSETGFVRYIDYADRITWEKHEKDLLMKIDFAPKEFEFIKDNSALFDEAIDWVKSRKGVEITRRYFWPKTPENNLGDMTKSRRVYFTNYDW